MARSFVMGAQINLTSKGMTTGIKKAEKVTRKFKGQVSETNRKVKKWGVTTSKIKTKLVGYGSKVKKATKEMLRMNKESKKLKGSMGGLPKILGAIGAALTFNAAANWLVNSNADMETYQNTLTVILGSQEKAIEQLQWAEKFASTTPFEISSIVEATAKLESYGLQSKKVLGITGDMASVMGKDLIQAVEAVADAQTGEVERLKEFGITKDMIKEQSKLMGMTAINAKGSITDLAAFNTALFTLMEKKFQGGMAMQATTWKGMLSNAKDFMSKLGRKIGEPVFIALKGHLESALMWVNNLDEAKIDKFAKNIGDGIANMVDGIINVIGWFIKWKEVIIPIVSGIVAALVTLKIIAVVSTMIGVLTTVTALFGVALSAAIWPITLTVAAIALLVAGGVALVRNFDKIKKTVSLAFKAIGLAAEAAGGMIKAGFDRMKLIVSNFASAAFDSGKKFMTTLADGIKAGIAAPVDAVKKGFGKIRKMLPFSDAKEGPFSQLTHNGSRIMTTLGEGVDQGKGDLINKVDTALGDVSINPAGGGVPAAKTGKIIQIRSLIENLNIAGMGDKDPKQVAEEIIAAIYDKLSEAAEIMEGPGREALL